MTHRLLASLFAATFSITAGAQPCGNAPLQVQVLNSGGPELIGGHAGSGLLVRVHDVPRVLIDAGPGTAMRFSQAGAGIANLDALLFTHLRIERTNDLPALLQLAPPVVRKRPLPIYGPDGNRVTPSTVSFVRTLFDTTRGAWRQLGELLSPLARSAYKLEPHDVRPHPPTLGVARESRDDVVPVFANDVLSIDAIAVSLGQTPALAWRIESQGKRIVVSAHASGAALERFARGADLLIAPQMTMDDVDMMDPLQEATPAALGRLARAAGVKQLAVTPRGRATLGRETESSTTIRQYYSGALSLANDLDCITP